MDSQAPSPLSLTPSPRCSRAWVTSMEETYKVLDIEPSSVVTLEDYLKEYFGRIMKKLKEVGATADRTNFYV